MGTQDTVTGGWLAEAETRQGVHQVTSIKGSIGRSRNRARQSDVRLPVIFVRTHAAAGAQNEIEIHPITKICLQSYNLAIR